jgi:hypothetical protein
VSGKLDEKNRTYLVAFFLMVKYCQILTSSQELLPPSFKKQGIFKRKITI